MIRPVKTVISGLSLAFGLLATQSTARADFTANAAGLGGGASGVSVSYPGAGSPNPWTGYAGQINWDAQNPTVIPGLTDTNGNFSTFCIQLGQYTANPQTFHATDLALLPDTNGIGNPGMGATKAARIAELFAERHSTLVTDENKQAFQLAIWEIVYENSPPNAFTLGSGTLTASGGSAAAISTANNWLATLDGTARLNGNGAVVALANVVGLQGLNGAQDQVALLRPGFVFNPVGDIVPTPVPPAAVLAVAGLLPCLALRRRLLGTKAE